MHTQIASAESGLHHKKQANIQKLCSVPLRLLCKDVEFAHLASVKAGQQKLGQASRKRSRFCSPYKISVLVSSCSPLKVQGSSSTTLVY